MILNLTDICSACIPMTSYCVHCICKRSSRRKDQAIYFLSRPTITVHNKELEAHSIRALSAYVGDTNFKLKCLKNVHSLFHIPDFIGPQIKLVKGHGEGKETRLQIAWDLANISVLETSEWDFNPKALNEESESQLAVHLVLGSYGHQELRAMWQLSPWQLWWGERSKPNRTECSGEEANGQRWTRMC